MTALEDKPTAARSGLVGAAPVSDEQVLSTLNADGSRRWLRPRVSRGKFWHARRVVAYGLIVLFTIVPYLKVNGRPLMLLDVVHRQFTFFGVTFLPTDTLLMALLIVSVFLLIFLVTALFGRVWCGWACPQTVYMEFLYRPIERLFDGEPGKKRSISRVKGARKVLKHVTFVLCSMFLANTFLAYFVPPEQLLGWIRGSPLQHPTAFLVMAITTGLMLFDFGYFREQTCLVACPYGRFQSAMLDRHSMIVTYDERRGEPRGKKRSGKDVGLPVLEAGDCIDCKMCVTTCPTGIDIRNGLQMECIGCAQCIDACNSVMDKVGRPRGLIRYSSLAIIRGEHRHFIRPRVIVYPTVMAVLLVVFGALLASRATAEAQVLPRQGSAFYALDTGEVANQVRMRLVNRGTAPAAYTISVESPAGARLDLDAEAIALEPSESRIVGFVVALPGELFGSRGRCELVLRVTGDDGFTKLVNYHVLGPVHRSAP